jgi:hypothetical protein
VDASGEGEPPLQTAACGTGQPPGCLGPWA